MDAVKKEATEAAAPADKDYYRRFSDLEMRVYDVVAWTSMLGMIVEDLPVFRISARESDLVFARLLRVSKALTGAVDNLDAAYHQRRDEEAA